MDTMLLSRTYLESLSTADLFSLAEEYGIDIPENLNRRFIIGELLDISGDCGGYNLGFAWLSGILAGEHIGGNHD